MNDDDVVDGNNTDTDNQILDENEKKLKIKSQFFYIGNVYSVDVIETVKIKGTDNIEYCKYFIMIVLS